jgi:hypothetical protein
MSTRFIEDKTINYINQIRKVSKSELFIDYNRLFLNDKDIKQYVKDVVNEISKKNNYNNNKNNKKNKKY